MTILNQIVSVKYIDVEKRKNLFPVSVLKKSKFFSEKPKSLKNALLSEYSTGIIAEFKRRSPSKGVLNESARPGEVSAGYFASGSAAISVLTDQEFFAGSGDDLAKVRSSVDCPVLCKDFIIDEYQITEARSNGADAVLLIADILPAEKLDELYRFVLSLGMEALIEVHNKEYLSVIPQDAAIIGINSRNLSSFNVSLNHALELANYLPEKIVKVAESGIKSSEDYYLMRNAGFNAFLIGEYFMSSEDPGKTCREFIESVCKDDRFISTGKTKANEIL